MFFEMHEEKKIGYKQLSLADLGISSNSHQTHIGLCKSVLSFLSDRDAVSENSIFIYEEKFEYIDAYFDRIENPNGTFRSPKIRTGNWGCVSIVSTIRNIVMEFDEDTKWYLIWFGLKNSKVVFYLFNNNSIDYDNFLKYGLKLNEKGAKSISSDNENFAYLMNHIENKININGEEEIKELEIISQIENITSNRKYKAYDIEKANEISKKVGREGEELINHYLANQKKRGQIIEYNWYNKVSESGFPYDFSIQDCHNNIIYLDVKTTGFNFEQKMIFSSQEIDYISSTQNSYYIYRVYKNTKGEFLLRICDNCKVLSMQINEATTNYSESIKKLEVDLKGAKLAVAPNINNLTFKSEIPIYSKMDKK